MILYNMYSIWTSHRTDNLHWNDQLAINFIY